MQRKESDEGYGYEQLEILLDFPWNDSCSPVRLKKNLSEETLSKVPFLRMVRRLMDELSAKGELKLTQVGNLPGALCKELYSLCPYDDMLESGISKMRGESDCLEIMLLHGIVKDLGWVKHRLGKISLTSKGKQILNDPREILRQILWFFCMYGVSDFYDGYQFENLNRGSAFLWMLLYKYGAEDRSAYFYTKKLANVLPELFWLRREDWEFAREGVSRPMYTRLFVRFLAYFGVIEFSGERHHDFYWTGYDNPIIHVTPLLYELIEVDEPTFEGPELPKMSIVDDDIEVPEEIDSSSVTFHSAEEAKAFIAALRGFDPSKPMS